MTESIKCEPLTIPKEFTTGAYRRWVVYDDSIRDDSFGWTKAMKCAGFKMLGYFNIFTDGKITVEFFEGPINIEEVEAFLALAKVTK